MSRDPACGIINCVWWIWSFTHHSIKRVHTALFFDSASRTSSGTHKDLLGIREIGKVQVATCQCCDDKTTTQRNLGRSHPWERATSCQRWREPSVETRGSFSVFGQIVVGSCRAHNPFQCPSVTPDLVTLCLGSGHKQAVALLFAEDPPAEELAAGLLRADDVPAGELTTALLCPEVDERADADIADEPGAPDPDPDTNEEGMGEGKENADEETNTIEPFDTPGTGGGSAEETPNGKNDILDGSPVEVAVMGVSVKE
ncbi:hypothetical protein C8R44DRAFT_951599 [Mycena epipterygia]|nr:hypothetical protein C8R44DRAFT_951599 [Mycena epipterygia]